MTLNKISPYYSVSIPVLTALSSSKTDVAKDLGSPYRTVRPGIPLHDPNQSSVSLTLPLYLGVNNKVPFLTHSVPVVLFDESWPIRLMKTTLDVDGSNRDLWTPWTGTPSIPSTRHRVSQSRETFDPDKLYTRHLTNKMNSHSTSVHSANDRDPHYLGTRRDSRVKVYFCVVFVLQLCTKFTIWLHISYA